MIPLSLSSPSSSSSLLLPPKTLIPKTLTLPPPPPSIPKRHFLPKPLHCSSPPSSIEVADVVEKDYSFLDSTSPHQLRSISAAQLSQSSKVLVSFPTVGFLDALADAGPPCQLIVAVHESLFVLAMVKESNDAVRCFQGGFEVVPNKFSPFDVVFVNYFPGLGVGVDELFGAVAKLCKIGARLVISCDQGRQVIEGEHRQQHPDIVISTLPDKTMLEKSAAVHSFQLTEFVDEPAFYLAVLKSNS